MKKSKFVISLLVVLFTIILAGCGNQQVFDATYTFDYAIIELPNHEIVEGEIDSWRDYDGEQLQIVIDGVTYLTHSENVVMVAR